MAMNGLAMSYCVVAEKREKALQLAEQTLELRKRHLGPTHNDTLVSTSNLAWIYLQQKQVDKAVPLFEEALAGLRAKYPPLHPERIVTTVSLANAYHAAEQLDRALPMQEMVTSQYRTAYGLEDRATQSCIDQLIAYSVDAGTCDKAEALLKSIRAIEANSSAAGKQQQDQREKRLRELIQRVRPAADKYQQELAAKKDDHPDTLAARQAFALVLRGQNRSGAAAYHLKAVLNARERLLGADQLDTQTCRLELGATRLRQQRYAEAEPLLLTAFAGLKLHESTMPAAKGRVTEALERIVQLYDGWNKKEQATEWRQKLDEHKNQ
jgi:tetratricopeptide (TPR) repeat protein